MNGELLAKLIIVIFNESNIRVDIERHFDKYYIADLFIQRDESSKAIVEIKAYRSKRVSINQIIRALDSISLILGKDDNYDTNGLLVMTSYIEPEIKRSLEKSYGIAIWDRASLFQLTENLPTARDTLVNILLEDSEGSDDIFPEADINKSSNINHIWELKPTVHIKLSSKGSKLCMELKSIESGRNDFRNFEKKCQEILEYLFEDDLTAWTDQSSTNDGLNRFDLICRIASVHDFWRSLGLNFNTRYILFEFKNYADKIKQGEVYTTEKYLFTKALRSVGFIIAKNGADKNASTAMKGALREHGKLLICLNPNDLCQMLDLKDSGGDYNGYLANIVDKFLIELSR